MKIILDVMGGDRPPEEFVEGAFQAIKEYGTNLILVGDEEIIRNYIDSKGYDYDNIEIVNAPVSITMEDSAMSVVKEKIDSSMHTGLKMLSEGKGDAFVSAGNTGALLAGATFVVRRIRGLRAAIAMVLPLEKPTLLMDCGANIAVTSENLEQFAIMGSIYAEKLMGIEKPRVGLINNGTEKTKGTQILQETYQKLSENEDLNFVGNIEGKDIPFSKADVLITDGFTGNVVLKLTEGFGKFMMDQMKELFMRNAVTKATALLMKKNLKSLKKRFDSSEYGGAPLLGISKPVIKAHGSSDSVAIKNAIRQAEYFVNTGIILDIARQSSKITMIPAVRKKEKTEEKQDTRQ